MFHSFQDILAVTDGYNLSIWNINSCNRVVNISNNPPLKPTLTHPTEPNAAAYNISALAAVNNSRITTMNWINESYDTLIMVSTLRLTHITLASSLMYHCNKTGSDDGAVKIWRDVSDSDSLVFPNSKSEMNKAINNECYTSPGVDLASAFIAMPDVAKSSRGILRAFRGIADP
jgi:hypothetical protein